MFTGPELAATPPDAPACADAWHERQLAILSELAEAGLEIALALKTRIVETVVSEPDAGTARASSDLARAFDRVSRAVRLSIALRKRVLKDAAAAPARPRSNDARYERAVRVRRIVKRIARDQFGEGFITDAMDDQARERLFDVDITGDLLDRPFGAVVAKICADLCLTPPWLDLAKEAWAQAEIIERPPGSPYANWPDLPPPPCEPEDDPEEDDPDDDPGDENARDPPPEGGP